jgi:hypothetical protein
MSSTPWLCTQTGISQFLGGNEASDHGWNPVNLLMNSTVIQYSVNATWEFNPELHVYRITHDGTAGQTLQIKLPIMAHLYQQSAIWFFWLGTNTDGAILEFAALDDNSSVNGTAGPSASYSFTCDTDRHLFIVMAVEGNYFIKMVQGRNFSVAAGTGTVVTGSPDYVVSAFAGVPVQLPNITVAAATTYYGNNGVGNATETSVNGIIMSQAGVLSNLYIKTAANVTADSHTFTLRKGSTYAGLADTTLTCAIASGAASGSDITHSVVVAAGDIITIKDVQAGAAEAVRAAISFCFKPSAV